MKKMITIILNFWRSGLFLGITVFLFTHNFGSGKGPGILHFDKLVHLGIFYVLSFLMLFDYMHRKSEKYMENWWLIFLMAVVYGGGIELIQNYFLQSRSGSYYDLVFDAIGAFAGVYTFILSKKSRLV